MEAIESGKLDDLGRSPRFVFSPGQCSALTLRLVNTAADADTLPLVVGGVTYTLELDTDATFTAGNLPVTVADGTIAVIAPAIATKINNSIPGLKAASFTLGSERRVVIWTSHPSNAAFTATDNISGANNVLSATTSFGGQASSNAKIYSAVRAIASSAEAAIGASFVVPFTIANYLVNVTDANGVVREGTGGVTDLVTTVTVPTGGADNILTISDGSTMTLASGDRVRVTIFGV